MHSTLWTAQNVLPDLIKQCCCLDTNHNSHTIRGHLRTGQPHAVHAEGHGLHHGGPRGVRRQRHAVREPQALRDHARAAVCRVVAQQPPSGRPLRAGGNKIEPCCRWSFECFLLAHANALEPAAFPHGRAAERGVKHSSRPSNVSTVRQMNELCLYFCWVRARWSSQQPAKAEPSTTL